MSKLLFVVALVAAMTLSGCRDSKKTEAPASSTPSEHATADQPEQLIVSMCNRDFGEVQRQQCVADETKAYTAMIGLANVPQNLVERCAKVPSSRYSIILNCIKTGMQPAHSYAMEEDGEYGYEGALSKNEIDAGKSVNPILMFRYLGEKNGTYTVQSKDGPAAYTASCKNPCEFIKMQTYYAGQLVKSDTVRSTGTAVIDGVLKDARNGTLKKYVAPKN